MNRKSPDGGKKKLGAWLSALAMASLMGAYALFILLMLRIEPDMFLTGIWVCLPLPLAVIVGVIVALWQRLHEIDGGEEDEAAKY
jgi:hypothetical protein